MKRSDPDIAIVGGESLLGSEIREVLSSEWERAKIHLIGADEEETGRIVGQADEPLLITPLEKTRLADADLVMLAGSQASSRKAWQLLADSPSTPVVDVTRTLEDVPSALVLAPGFARQDAKDSWPVIVAHPASVALACFFRRIETRFAVKRSVAEIFEPASERGRAGVDELHKQTVNLFSFQKLPQNVYDTQVAFAMLARYGEESSPPLEHAEDVIERHLASLLCREHGSHMPSLRLLHAPVFHGYSISVWAELEGDATAAALADALASDFIDVRREGEEPPANVGVAGLSGIAAGDIRPDRNHPRAFWFWLAFDNLRLAAEMAVRLAQQILGVATA